MTAYTLGEAGALALARIGRRAGVARETSPCAVLPNSREAGTFEHEFFASPAKGETDQLLRVARRALDAGRGLRRMARRGERALTASERTVAALTDGAVRVLEELLALARLNQGRVYPSYDHLARVTGLGRATVARGLRVLEEVGFLLRQRRFVRRVRDGAVEGELDTERPGPRIAQTSNAYRMTLPRAVLAHLPRWMRPAPPPDDAAEHHAEHDAQQKAMRATLTCREHALAMLDGPLGRALAQLGAGIDARDSHFDRAGGRESHADPRSQHNHYYYRCRMPFPGMP